MICGHHYLYQPQRKYYPRVPNKVNLSLLEATDHTCVPRCLRHPRVTIDYPLQMLSPYQLALVDQYAHHYLGRTIGRKLRELHQ